jgi:predicted ribosomally synthesized peptide with SipW-like signal peptide
MSNDKHRGKEFRPAGSARMARMGGFLLSSLLVGFLVITGSRAAFTDTTDNTGNSFTAGDVDLVDDDSGSVMFNVSNMEPADSVTDCILVTYQGSIVDPSAVKLYSGGYTDSGDFADYLNLIVEEGSGGSFGDCTLFSLENTIESGGTVTDFDTTHTDYASGAGVWDPSGTPQSKTYRITVELDAATPNAEQGESVTALTFTWEVQN